MSNKQRIETPEEIAEDCLYGANKLDEHTTVWNIKYRPLDPEKHVPLIRKKIEEAIRKERQKVVEIVLEVERLKGCNESLMTERSNHIETSHANYRLAEQRIADLTSKLAESQKENFNLKKRLSESQPEIKW